MHGSSTNVQFDLLKPHPNFVQVHTVCLYHFFESAGHLASLHKNCIHYRNTGLCRVLFVGHSAKKSLSSAALGKILLSITSSFTECRTLDTEIYSAKMSLPSAALGKVLLSIMSSFTECRTLGTEIHSTKMSLPSAEHSAKAAFGKGPSAVI
jgi:hypothetical protein